MNVTKELTTIKELVKSVLYENGDTRSNDTLLYIECCKKMGVKTIEDMERMNLSIISVHKIRQVVQNKDMMYLPVDEVREARGKRNIYIKDYMSKIQPADTAWV